MKVKAFIHAQFNEYERTFSYSTHYCDMQDYGYTLLEVRELEIDEPNFEALANKTIVALRKKQAAVIATAQKEAMRVQETIDKLLCLEYRP